MRRNHREHVGLKKLSKIRFQKAAGNLRLLHSQFLRLGSKLTAAENEEHKARVAKIAARKPDVSAEEHAKATKAHAIAAKDLKKVQRLFSKVSAEYQAAFDKSNDRVKAAAGIIVAA